MDNSTLTAACSNDKYNSNENDDYMESYRYFSSLHSKLDILQLALLLLCFEQARF